MLNNEINTNAGLDQLVCSPEAHLSAQELVTGETGYWTVNNSQVIISNTTDPNTQVSNLINGNNTFTWTSNNGTCTVTDQVIISNNGFHIDAGLNQTTCETSYTLRASDPFSGTSLWTIVSGTGRFANPTSFETLVEDIGNGPNTFRWTVSRNGCTASDEVTITNNFYAANAGADQSLCSDHTTLNAQALNPAWGVTGTWTAQSGGGIFFNPNTENTLVTGLTIGDNRLRWTIRKTENNITCSSFDEIVITNNSIIASAGLDQTTCNNYTALIAAPLNTTAIGLWTGGGVSVTIANPTSTNTLVSGLQQGINTFAWTVTDNGCTGTTTVRVTNNSFMPDAGADQNISNNYTNLTASLPDASAVGNWSIISGNGIFAEQNNPATLVTGLGFGQNTFRWTVSWNGCTAFDDVNITYIGITANAGNDQVICSDRTFLSASNPAPAIGQWSITSGNGVFTDPLDGNTEVTGILPGSVNIYRWTVEINGYSEFDEVVVTSEEFDISAGADIVTCNDHVLLDAETAGINGTGNWTILIGSGSFENIEVSNTQVTNLALGTNIFRWTVTKNTGCTDSDIIEVTYDMPPIADFETDISSGCSPLDVNIINTSS
ncbi:MAG: hypothetical protein HC831_20905, partial [Chloroflexia bacterium]|nr:hypothetical protein [Chloroflexia bacterium]